MYHFALPVRENRCYSIGVKNRSTTCLPRYRFLRTFAACVALLPISAAAWGAASANPAPAGGARVTTPDTNAKEQSSEERANELAARFFDPLLADARTDTARASLLHQRGVLYLRSLCRAQAVADLNEAVRLSPQNSGERYDLFFHRACAYLLLPTPDAPAALLDINKCLAQNPADAEALIVRAEAYRKLGKPVQARADLLRAAQIAPKGDAAIRALLQNAQNAVR